MASIASSSRPTSQAIHDEEWEEKQRLSEVWKIKLCIAVSFTVSSRARAVADTDCLTRTKLIEYDLHLQLMLVEIVVGYQFSCLALVADSYHVC